MRRYSWLAVLAGILATVAAPAQSVPVSAVWPLNATTLQNPSPTPPDITATTEVVSAGNSPAMSVFDYGGTPLGQRLFAGTAGWTTSPVNASRYIQFEVRPNPGYQLTVTSINFQYGGAAGAPNRMGSEVRYSVNNGTTWLTLGAPLNYPPAGFNTFAATPSLPALVPGQKFLLRIHPYALQNQTAMSPLFAVHSAVTINGNSAPLSAPPDLQVTKKCTTQGQANQGVLCTVTVTNTSATTASFAPLTLTDLPTGPAGSLFTGSGGNLNPFCIPAAGPLLPINCTSSVSIPPGQSRNALFSFKLPTTGGTLNNCATATQPIPAGSTQEANMANNNSCTQVVVAAVGGADLGVGKSCVVMGPGRLVRCTITVNNSGTTPSPAPWNLMDTITGLPPGSTLVSVGAGGIACPGVSLPMPMPGTMNCALYNPVLPNTPQVILIDFTLPQAGSFNNCAAVSQTGPETNISNNQACTNLNVP